MDTVSRKFNRILELFQSTHLIEIVFTCVVAVALGVAYWGWTFVYEVFKPFLKVFGLKYLLAGLWILAPIFVPYVIRRPGIAFAASVIAAFVEGLLTQWGITAIIWGAVQGIAPELVFFATGYRRWDKLTLGLAAILSALASYMLDYFYYANHQLDTWFNIVQLLSFMLSALIFSLGPTLYLAKRLQKIRALDQFLITKNNDA